MGIPNNFHHTQIFPRVVKSCVDKGRLIALVESVALIKSHIGDLQHKLAIGFAKKPPKVRVALREGCHNQEATVGGGRGCGLVRIYNSGDNIHGCVKQRCGFVT